MKLNFALQNYVLILNKLHQKQQRARENIQSTLLLCFVGDLLKPISHILHDLFYVQKHPLQRPFSSKKGKFHIHLHQPRTRRSRTPSHRWTPAPESSPASATGWAHRWTRRWSSTWSKATRWSRRRSRRRDLETRKPWPSYCLKIYTPLLLFTVFKEKGLVYLYVYRLLRGDVAPPQFVTTLLVFNYEQLHFLMWNWLSELLCVALEDIILYHHFWLGPSYVPNIYPCVC